MGDCITRCGGAFLKQVLLVLIMAQAALAQSPFAAGVSQGLITAASGSHLLVSLEAEERCFFGDLDVLYRESKRLSGDGRILMTLEPLGGAVGEEDLSQLHVVFTQDGLSRQASMSLPKPKKPRLYGLFTPTGFNVVLQNNANVTDDGSLSVYCGQREIEYVNVEAQHGHRGANRKMLKRMLRELKRASLTYQ